MLSYMVHKHFSKLNIWTLKLWRNHRNMSILNARWAFNVSNWKPTMNEILMASSYIQPEEKQRISKFVFQNDAKSSLIGRLMMRKFVHLTTNIPYEDISFGRDDRGKPYLLTVGDTVVNFNVSHQGDYAVLAGDASCNIGIDIMKIEPPANKNIPEFFRLMKRQFSTLEWSTIRSYDTELQQIACFYRIWCLKESYVKNIGLGITIPLDEISFLIKTRQLKVGEIVKDTVLYIKNVLKDDWVFEETLIDNKHAVAVSLPCNKDVDVPLYTILTFDELVKESKPLCETDSNFGNDFLKKEVKHF